jgi:hypothetical protein
MTDRIVGTECASCCGAFRSWKFPSLLYRVSKMRFFHVEFSPSFGGALLHVLILLVVLRDVAN